MFPAKVLVFIESVLAYLHGNGSNRLTTDTGAGRWDSLYDKALKHKYSFILL